MGWCRYGLRRIAVLNPQLLHLLKFGSHVVLGDSVLLIDCDASTELALLEPVEVKLASFRMGLWKVKSSRRD